MPSNKHHKWLKKRDWLKVQGAVHDPDRDVDLLARKYKERDKHGRLPHHWMAAKAQTHTHALANVGVLSIWYNEEALTTRDNKGETPIDIARRSGACAEIIGLLSQNPEAARSLGWEMLRLFAPVGYWWNEMGLWIESRSYADCHKFIDEHDDELVREVLKYWNSQLLLAVACNSQVYSDSLVLLVLRMIHRYPLSLSAEDPEHSETALQWAQDPEFDACLEIQQILSLDPTHITSTPFPTLLLHSLPTKYHEIYDTYNTVCQFLRLTVSPHDNAELGEQSKVDLPDGEYLAIRILYDLNHNMSLGYAIGGQILTFLKPDPS